MRLQEFPFELLQNIYLFSKSSNLVKTCRVLHALLEPVTQTKKLLIQNNIWSPSDSQYTEPTQEKWNKLFEDSRISISLATILCNIYDSRVFNENIIMFAIKTGLEPIFKRIIKRNLSLQCIEMCAVQSCIDGQVMLFAEILRSFQVSQESLNECLNMSAKHNHYDCIKLAIEAKADIKNGDYYALLIACKNGYLTIVKLLVESGAQISAFNNKAVQYASEYGHMDLLLYCISVGANIHENQGKHTIIPL